MIEERELSLKSSVDNDDKIRVVTSAGLSQSIEVGNLKTSLSVADLPGRVSTLEDKADDNDSALITISNDIETLKLTVGEKAVDGDPTINSGLFQEISNVRLDFTPLSTHLGEISRLDGELNDIRADLTSIDGTNGKLEILTDKQNTLEEDIANLTITKLEVLENYREKLVTLSGTSTTIDLSLANVFTHTLSGNTTYTISNAVSGQAHSFALIINMDSTVRTLTFPSSVKWQGGEIPDMTTANKTYVLTFMTVDGGTTWLGMFGGEF